MPKPITIHAKGFAAFASVQGNSEPNRGIAQTSNGKWYGWQTHPQYKTSLYGTRAEAKTALLRDAPTETR